MVSALNVRFRAGTPSDDPASAGVVLHALNRQLGVEPSPWLSSKKTGSGLLCRRKRTAPLHIPRRIVRPLCFLPDPGVRAALLSRQARAALRLRARWWHQRQEVPRELARGRVSEQVHAWLPIRDQSRAARLGRGTEHIAGYAIARGACGSASGEHAIRREGVAGSLPRARKAGHVQLQYNQYNELVLAADTCNSLLPGTIETVYMLPQTTITDAIVAPGPN